MSDIAIAQPAAAAAGGSGAFGVRGVAAMVVVGILAFVGMIVLSAYAPDMQSGRNGGAHALSNAAVGFSGIVRLAEATGRDPKIVRDPHALATDSLVVLAPEQPTTDMTQVLAERADKPTLIVLPKWQTRPDATHAGWVRYTELRWPSDPEGVLAPMHKLTVTRSVSGGRPLVAQSWMPATLRFRAPRALQTIAGPEVKPLLADEAGRVVLAEIGDKPLYVLADPDLVSNAGIGNAKQARAALDLLDWLNASGATSIAFDVTLNGLGRAPSPLRLAFDPPFLAMTLTVAAALLLAGIQATAQFGAPRRRERAIAFGKTALIDNAAALVRKAGRRGALGQRYLDLVRERASVVFGVPARLRDTALDRYLDGLTGRARFTTLAEQAEAARDPRAVLDAAQALHGWLWEKTR